jgi:hypothetical protein
MSSLGTPEHSADIDVHNFFRYSPSSLSCCPRHTTQNQSRSHHESMLSTSSAAFSIVGLVPVGGIGEGQSGVF